MSFSWFTVKNNPSLSYTWLFCSSSRVIDHICGACWGAADKPSLIFSQCTLYIEINICLLLLTANQRAVFITHLQCTENLSKQMLCFLSVRFFKVIWRRDLDNDWPDVLTLTCTGTQRSHQQSLINNNLTFLCCLQLQRLTVEVQDGLTAHGRVCQDQRLQVLLQSSLTQLCRRLQAEVSNTLQLQHL